MTKLVLKNISLTQDSEDLIYDLSATFNSGINLLIGPTTAGKTTLMRIIAGLVKPSIWNHDSGWRRHHEGSGSAAFGFVSSTSSSSTTHHFQFLTTLLRRYWPKRKSQASKKLPIVLTKWQLCWASPHS